MKKYSFIMGLIALVACDPAPKKQETKQEYTVVIYALDWNKNQFITSVAQRIIKDTFAFSVVDSSSTEVKQKKQSVLDTSYLIPITDTARDQAGKPKMDTTGKAEMVFHWVPLPKNFLVNDFNRVIK